MGIRLPIAGRLPQIQLHVRRSSPFRLDLSEQMLGFFDKHHVRITQVFVAAHAVKPYVICSHRQQLAARLIIRAFGMFGIEATIDTHTTLVPRNPARKRGFDQY